MKFRPTYSNFKEELQFYYREINHTEIFSNSRSKKQYRPIENTNSSAQHYLFRWRKFYKILILVKSMNYSNLSNIQGHPIATAVAPFKSISTVTNVILPNSHDCLILVSDKTYNGLVSSYRICSQGIPMACEAISKILNRSIQRGEMYFWSSQYSHYYPVNALISFDSNKLFLTIVVNNINHVVYLDSICPYSVFTSPIIPYKLISFNELGYKIQAGDIVNYKVDPMYQKYFGQSGDPNSIVTVFDKNGIGYLVRGRLASNGMIYPPI